MSERPEIYKVADELEKIAVLKNAIIDMEAEGLPDDYVICEFRDTDLAMLKQLTEAYQT